MKVFNIKWDTDGEVVEGLPTEMEVPDNFYGDYDAIENYLSNAEGFFVLGGYEVELPKNGICTPTVRQKTYDAVADMIRKGIRFFECELEDCEGYREDSIMIAGIRKPSIGKARTFLKDDLARNKEKLVGVREWEPKHYDSVKSFVEDMDNSYDLENVMKWPVFQ